MAKVEVERLRKILAGVGGGVRGEVMIRVVFMDRFGRFVGTAKNPVEALRLDESRSAIG